MEISDNRVAHFRIFTKKNKNKTKMCSGYENPLSLWWTYPIFVVETKRKHWKIRISYCNCLSRIDQKGLVLVGLSVIVFVHIHPERIFSPRVQIKIKRRYSRKLIQIWNRFFSEKRFLITPTHEYKNSAQNNIRRHSIVSHLLILSRKISYAMSKCVFLCYFLIT